MQRFLRLCTGLLRACVRSWWNGAFVEGGDGALCSLHLSYNYIHAVPVADVERPERINPNQVCSVNGVFLLQGS